MEFDSDGRLVVPRQAEITKDTEYLWILKSILDLPFPVGKNLLIDFIVGETDNKSVIGCKLDTRKCFGCLAYTKEELDGMISRLLLNGMITQVASKKNKFWKVLEITKKGFAELEHPTLNAKTKNENLMLKHETIITEKERKVFEAFGSVLEKFNDNQKKAIVSNAKEILCIAGAGSGKTTVLTKRIEFLIRYKSVDPKTILAITFTRKARQEMEKRLSESGIYGVNIQTFNSFCERILLQNNDKIYGREMRVITFKDKIVLINKALSSLGTNLHSAINLYFTSAQRRGKTKEQLISIFRGDCFFVRDYLKFKNEHPDDIEVKGLDYTHQKSAELVFGVCKYLDESMRRNGLRDFADQLVDVIKYFKDLPSEIPKYDYVLVDEFQDVNSTQIELIDLINPSNIFCVGDPRQSIFGWRGSNIKYILNFKEKYPDCELVSLIKNYRSSKYVVDLINESIKSMNLADLESSFNGEKDLKLMSFKKETMEFSFIVEKIISSAIPRNEIFILARTNKQLNRMSDYLKSRRINHLLRSEDTNNSNVENTDETKLTLATVHAIKGLEAEMVFVMGCNTNSFPCRSSEHPVIDLVQIEEYDKEEEERRLFYVALSRAKNHLYLTYTGALTYFVSAKMKDMLDSKKVENHFKDITVQSLKPSSSNVLDRLKSWRSDLSRKDGLPAYMILSNATLEAIAVRMPLDVSELHNIPGMGPVKIQKYGSQILEQLI